MTTNKRNWICGCIKLKDGEMDLTNCPEHQKSHKKAREDERKKGLVKSPEFELLAQAVFRDEEREYNNRIAELKNLLERWDSWYGGNLYAETRLVADTRKALKKEVDEDGSKK